MSFQPAINSIFEFDYKNNKSHQQLVQKIAQPFIAYKSIGHSQNQINIAGYKTAPLNINPKDIKINKQEYFITKESIEKYLYTFSFEIGCDLPSEEEIKLIYNLLLTHSKTGNYPNDFILEQMEQDKQKQYPSKRKPFSPRNNQTQNIKKSSLYLLIKLCIQIYVKSKRSNIGGIIERLIIGIKKQIEQQDQNQQNEDLKTEKTNKAQ